MGEIADMMLEGLLCQGCGEFIGDFESGEGDGFPGWCDGCRPKAEPRQSPHQAAIAKRKPHVCPTCKRRFRVEQAVKDHARDVHGIKP